MGGLRKMLGCCDHRSGTRGLPPNHEGEDLGNPDDSLETRLAHIEEQAKAKYEAMMKVSDERREYEERRLQQQKAEEDAEKERQAQIRHELWEARKNAMIVQENEEKEARLAEEERQRVLAEFVSQGNERMDQRKADEEAEMKKSDEARQQRLQAARQEQLELEEKLRNLEEAEAAAEKARKEE